MISSIGYMARIKQFKTIDEQIEILKDKGLVIGDKERTKKILLRENYFFINGYRHVFMKANDDKRFIDNVTFDELYSLFCFDRNIRNIMFKYLLIVENNLKSIFSYHLSSKYGYKEKDYLKISNFTTNISKHRQVVDVINKMKRQIRVNAKQHTATLHYLTNYGYIPMWILVKVLSFGIISELYMILKHEDKKEIANYYGVDVEELSTFLPIMSNYRNLCAHEDILYNHKTQRGIPNNKYHNMLNIALDEGEYIYGKNDLYSLIIMFKYMLSQEDFKLLIHELGYEIDTLDGKIDSIKIEVILDMIGFPINWQDIVEL